MNPEPTIQSQGGKARAASLTPEGRSQIASTAATARWSLKANEYARLPIGSQGINISLQMTAEDFDLLIATLQLWEPKIVFTQTTQ